MTELKTPQAGTSQIQRKAVRLEPPHLVEGDFCFGLWEVGGTVGRQAETSRSGAFLLFISSTHLALTIALFIYFSGSVHCFSCFATGKEEHYKAEFLYLNKTVQMPFF